jgi:hypothetical protein
MTFLFTLLARRRTMFDHNLDVNKERSAKAGDILVYWLDDRLFSVMEKDWKHVGRIDLRPKDDKFLFPLKGNEEQIYNACQNIAKLFAAAVCCDVIPFKMPEHMNRLIGFELVPFK